MARRNETPKNPPLNPALLSWSALLSQCVQLAQAAVGLPGDDAAGRAWRASVPHVIRLQAVWFALQRQDELQMSERPLARDRAAVIHGEADAALREIWKTAETPEGIISLLHDVGDLLRDPPTDA
jgi:hypothetical protein